MNNYNSKMTSKKRDARYHNIIYIVSNFKIRITPNLPM